MSKGDWIHLGVCLVWGSLVSIIGMAYDVDLPARALLLFGGLAMKIIGETVGRTADAQRKG